MNDNPLLGKTITAAYIAEDRKALRFDILGGEQVIARVDADCCSETWVAEIEGPERLLGTVASVEDLDLPQEKHPEDAERDSMQYYGCNIATERGNCVIDYRNESNGYYGGSLCWGDKDFYGGVHKQNVSTEQWVLLSGTEATK